MEQTKQLSCSSEGRVGHLLIGWLVFRSLAAPVWMPNILGQDTHPKLLSGTSIGV